MDYIKILIKAGLSRKKAEEIAKDVAKAFEEEKENNKNKTKKKRITEADITEPNNEYVKE